MTDTPLDDDSGRRPRSAAAPPASPARSRRRARRLGAVGAGAALTAGRRPRTPPSPRGVRRSDDPPSSRSTPQRAGAVRDQLHHLPRAQRAGRARTAGPSLIGVGSAAVDFQVGTGRMPVTRQEAQVERKPPKFDRRRRPASSRHTSRSSAAARRCPTGDLRGCRRQPGRRRRAVPAQLLVLPRLRRRRRRAVLRQVRAVAARRHRPADLGGDADRPAEHAGLRRQPAHPRAEAAIIAYVQTLKAQQDPGGCGIGRLGPVPEGLVIFLVGHRRVMVFTTVDCEGSHERRGAAAVDPRAARPARARSTSTTTAS